MTMRVLIRFERLTDGDILDSYDSLRAAADVMVDDDDAFARVAQAIADELLFELDRRGLASLVGPNAVEA